MGWPPGRVRRGSVVGGGGGVVDEVGGILYAPAAVAECTPYTPCALCGGMHPVYPLLPQWWNALRTFPTFSGAGRNGSCLFPFPGTRYL